MPLACSVSSRTRLCMCSLCSATGTVLVCIVLFSSTRTMRKACSVVVSVLFYSCTVVVVVLVVVFMCSGCIGVARVSCVCCCAHARLHVSTR